ncbi:TetR/AcrR family transcriptional regulator [Pelagibius sp. Alg239-R121]|uniref:TetR/AcrR family transcriptional regulator n=1 Tax=Pelagibius sp. Alg239-R121 TaxID=2993448 RepID=UPI0024A73F0E|nr:TetR/AcrR family transcriptional regulator [Pelagibius sp. Alg239-R121]
MGRPSVKAQRSSEILDAFETCVARYGVEGATLERIAAEAGLARALIRHHVGNRDDLLKALTRRFLAQSERHQQDLLDYLPEGDRVLSLIDLLFDHSQSDQNFVLVAEALIAAAGERPELAAQLADWVHSFIALIAAELRREYDAAAADAIDAVAAGIAGIYFNVDSLTTLGDMGGLRQASKQAALRLVRSIELDHESR